MLLLLLLLLAVLLARAPVRQNGNFAALHKAPEGVVVVLARLLCVHFLASLGAPCRHRGILQQQQQQHEHEYSSTSIHPLYLIFQRELLHFDEDVPT